MNGPRWIIEAELELATPMHIGTGLASEIQIIDGDESKDVWAAELALDGDDKPYIPGASLKGALRALAERTGALETLSNLFGAISGDTTVSGQAEFRCAWCTSQPNVTETNQPRIAIDRVTGTVQDQKLFYTRLISVGTKFKLRIIVQSASEPEIQALLNLLNCIDSDPSFALGAYGNQGRGRLQVAKVSTKTFGVKEAKKWLGDLGTQEAKPNWESYAATVNLNSVLPAPTGAIRDDKTLQLSLSLKFHTPFLVKQKGDKRRLDKNGRREEADAVPRRDASGKGLLPASSLRGRLRSQTERILRTLGNDVAQGHEAPAYLKGDPHKDLATLLFGTAGWRGIVSTDDLSCAKVNPLPRQEMVAIDRFTGGGKDGAKFNVDYFECPILEGSLSLDLARLKQAKLQGGVDAFWPALGLFTLVLRDLAEGDIGFGYGISKGYGQCRAEEVLTNWLAELQVLPSSLNGVPPAPTGDCATFALNALRNWLTDMSVNPITSSLPLTDNTPGRDVHAFELAPSTTGFHNPYNFIPLVRPNTEAWPTLAEMKKDKNGHDRYKGLSGRIVCKLTTQTPLFIGGERGTPRTGEATPVEPFILEGKIALPATSLRGMISSLFESVSDSNFRVLEQKKYSMRSSKKLSAMGRVVPHKEKLYLLPLALPMLEKDRRNQYAVGRWARIFRTERAQLRVYFDPEPGTPAFNSDAYYMQLPVINIADQVIADSTLLRFPSRDNNRQWLIGQSNNGRMPISKEAYENLEVAVKATYVKGWVRNIRCEERDLPRDVRHHVFLPCFVLTPKVSDLLEIPDGVVKVFEELADLASEMQFQEGESINDLQLLPYTPTSRTARSNGTTETRLRKGDLVFFDTDNAGKITEISFSSMWRTGIKKDGSLCNTADLLAQYDANLLPYGMKANGSSARSKLSSAESLFGFVEHREKVTDDQQAVALAGKVRVGFGIFSPVGAGNTLSAAKQDDEVTLKELSSPKPPSPALYFRPIASADAYVSKQRLADAPADHTLRGRKAYLHAWRDKGDVVKLGNTGKLDDATNGNFPWESKVHITDRDGNKRRVKIKPISKGQSFHFEIDFNNLSHKELEQLCTTLQPTAMFEHRLGMGKPLGLGSVKIEPVGLFVVNRNARYATDYLNAARYHVASRVDGAANWPTYLHTELIAPITFEAPTVNSLATSGFATVNSAVARALMLLGNPAAIGVPVHYPQVDLYKPNPRQPSGPRNPETPGTLENENFRWFVENDNASNNRATITGRHIKSITAQSVSLDTLPRIDATKRRE